MGGKKTAGDGALDMPAPQAGEQVSGSAGPLAALTRAANTMQEQPASTIRYVIPRPYSAGEHYDIVTADVVKRYEDPDLLDLVYGDTEVTAARRSQRQEPGTWYEVTP